MGSTITLYPYNILESGTLTITGTPDTGKPITRLYDRDQNLYWKDTVTEAKEFHVDQGSSILPVNFLAIPKHNFNGKALSLSYSDNDADWTEASGWTQADNLQIIKTFDSNTHRYQKFDLESIENPIASELFISFGYTFNVRFDDRPTGRDIDNVVWTRTIGGQERSCKYGKEVKELSYSMYLDGTSLVNYRAVLSYLSGNSKPFYMRDHEDNYRMCRILPGKEDSYVGDEHISVTVVFKEMI